MRPVSIFGTIPMLEIILTTSMDNLRKLKRFKGLGEENMKGYQAKAVQITNESINETVVVIVYPTMFTDSDEEVADTLLHEVIHAWDFTKGHYGYGEDTELNAYATTNLYAQTHAAFVAAKKSVLAKEAALIKKAKEAAKNA